MLNSTLLYLFALYYLGVRIQGINSHSDAKKNRIQLLNEGQKFAFRISLFSPSHEIVNRQHGVAQNSSGNSTCSNTSGFEIQQQSDLDALGSCTTVTGNIIITAVAIDTVTIPQGVQKVTGDVSVSQTSSVTSFTASGLQTITGTFELLNLTALQTLTAPSLTTVGGINFVILPLLQTMSLGINSVGNVIISDTELSALDGFSLETVNDFDISIGSLPCIADP
jgi:hypothetical protein